MSDEHNGQEPDAETVLQHAARKGLGSRLTVRLLAVLLWASFLGGIPMLIVWWWLLPPEYAAGYGLHELSWGFFMCWLASAVPAAIAIVLSNPGEAGREQQQGD